MLAQAVICVDLASNPSAVAGVPCIASQGLITVTVQLPDNGQAYDPVLAGQYFSYGFGVVVFAFLLGWTVAQVRKPIRR